MQASDGTTSTAALAPWRKSNCGLIPTPRPISPVCHLSNTADTLRPAVPALDTCRCCRFCRRHPERMLSQRCPPPPPPPGGGTHPLFSVFRQQVPQAVHRQLHPPPARPWPDAQRASSARRAQEGQLRSPHGWALTNEPPPPAGVSRGRTAAGRKTAF